MLRRRMHAGRLIPHLLKPGVLFHIALAFQSPASLFDGWWHDGKHRIDNSGVWKKGLTPVLPWVQDGTCEVPARGEAEPGHGGEQSFFVVGLPAPAQVHKFLPAAVTVPGCGQLSCRDHQFTSLKPPISWETQPLSVLSTTAEFVEYEMLKIISRSFSHWLCWDTFFSLNWCS